MEKKSFYSWKELPKETKDNVMKTTKNTKRHKPIFVIHEHKARNHHYDLRLEVDGVLKSWAIPKGLTLNPQEKLLAIPTDDHPLRYASFEGNIPEGKHGSGPVIVWDTGTYENVKEEDGHTIPVKKCLKEGQVEFKLHGKKLEGAYSLIHFKKKENQWLLVKMADEHVQHGAKPTQRSKTSALSGKTLHEVAQETSTTKVKGAQHRGGAKAGAKKKKEED